MRAHPTQLYTASLLHDFCVIYLHMCTLMYLFIRNSFSGNRVCVRAELDKNDRDLSVYCLPLLLSLWIVAASVVCVLQPVLSLQSCLAVAPWLSIYRAVASEFSPAVTLRRPSSLSFPSVFTLFFLRFSPTLWFQEVSQLNVCMRALGLKGWGQWSWQLRLVLLRFSGLNWDILSEWQTHLHQCVFHEKLFYIPLATHSSVNQPSISHMLKCTHTDRSRVYNMHEHIVLTAQGAVEEGFHFSSWQ